jgi:GTP-binding protein Era
MSDVKHVSGFVSIIGRPNAGKSTLLNILVGSKVAITAPKPQTTRNLIQGIWTAPNAQVIFVDTPGIHQSDSLLNRRMIQEIRTALKERDLLLYVADSTLAVGDQDRAAVQLLHGTPTPALLVLNKIDQLSDKRQLLPLIEAYKALFDFREFVPVSAVTGEGLDDLRAAILRYLPEGPQYFPPDQITDLPERFLVAELIREKVIALTHEEVPHAVAVLVDAWEEKPNITRIAATIYVERPGQKAILIGSKGAMIKRIGTLARQEIESMLGRKVYLELFVKVHEKWRESPQFLNQLDWRTMVGAGRPA